MKGILNMIKVGAEKAPTLYILLYCISRILDNYTTFLATPDLKFEGNWFIRIFHLSWPQIIIKDIIIVVLMIFGLIISVNFFHKYFQNKSIINRGSGTKIFPNKILFPGLVMVSCFFSHLFYSLFLACSNYLQYIYILKVDNIFSNISVWYVQEIIKAYSYTFIFYNVVFIIAGILASILFVKNIGKEYQNKSL